MMNNTMNEQSASKQEKPYMRRNRFTRNNATCLQLKFAHHDDFLLQLEAIIYYSSYKS